MSSEALILEDLLEITSSKRIHRADYVPDGIPFYRGKEVIERATGNTVSTELFIAPKQYEAIKSKFGSPQDGDILLTSVGTLGVAHYVHGDGEFYFKDGNVTWFRNFKNGIDSRFIYYWLTSPDTQKKLDELSIGSTQRALTIRALKSLKIELPSENTQREVVQILDALTHRITLLRETNKTLEAIAQAIFKSWFVDFDPVHAKMEGRQPEGMDEETAALFPGECEESELGLIPRGWVMGKVAELISLHKGTVKPNAQPNVEFQHYSIPSFDNGQMPITELGDAIKSNKTSVPSNAVLLSKLNPRIPRIWLPSDIEETAICSTEFLPFVPTEYSNVTFAYNLLSTKGFTDQLAQQATGTSNSHQRIKPSNVLCAPFVIPPVRIIQKYDKIASPILERLKHNRKQAETLTSIRDNLLPRLISGRLRLPEAEALIAEHA